MCKAYSVENFKNSNSYSNFIKYMLKKSQAFSLIYFRYDNNEKLSASAERIKNLLSPYEIYSHNGNQWPGMITLNENNHIYEIVLYRSDDKTEEILTEVTSIYDFDYPDFPMDLCFYRNGYGWLSAISHEESCTIFIDEENTINDLENLGIELSFVGEIDEIDLFFDEKAK